jgi:hypothetical protein
MASNCIYKEEGQKYTPHWNNNGKSFLGCQGLKAGCFPAQRENY